MIYDQDIDSGSVQDSTDISEIELQSVVNELVQSGF